MRIKYLLSGILRCGICEQPTRSTPKAHARAGYRCPSGHLVRDMERTDAYVVEAVLTRLESEEARELFRHEDQADELTKAVAMARELRARLDGFTDSAANGGISPDRLARIEAKLLPQIEAAEERASQIGVSPVVAELMGAQDSSATSASPKTSRSPVYLYLARYRSRATTTTAFVRR